MVSDNNIYTLLGFKKNTFNKKDDYLSRYYSSNNSPFQRISSSVSNIYKKVKRDVVFMFKYKGKSS